MSSRKATTAARREPESALEAELAGVQFDEAPVDESKTVVLTVNGKPIPEHLAHLVPYAATDQGISERENDGRLRAYTEVVRDNWDKKMDQRRAATEVWESEDPLVEAVDGVRQEGMGYRFLSPSVIGKRGLRKYEVVKDTKGDPVRVGNMVLGQMPIDLQDQRARYYQNKGNDELRQAHENLRVEQEKIIRTNPEIGNVMLRQGDHLTDRGYEEASGVSHEVGVRRDRGQIAA